MSPNKPNRIAWIWVIVFSVPIILLANHLLLAKHSSPHMRGRELAQNLGCTGCHEPSAQTVIMNPASLRGVIPSFHSAASVPMFWVKDEDEFREWVQQGVSSRIRQERERFHTDQGSHITMPAYGHTLDAAGLDDLYIYFQDENSFSLPAPETAVAKGAAVAEAHGCFACHGQHGLEGGSNPGSFKGYIPPWEGDDFDELVKNDAELREWIQTGHPQRFRRNPLANYFMDRQSVKMPAYSTVLDDGEIRELIAYIRWLPTRQTNQQSGHGVALPDNKANQGDRLFSKSGCTTCHNPSHDEGFTDRHGAELPPRSALAYRLRTIASVIDDRERQNRWQQNKLCHEYQEFDNEYQHIYSVILNGDKGENISTAMPAWRERANASDLPAERDDIHGVINGLLNNSVALSDVQIQGWRANARLCTGADKPMASLSTNIARRQQISSHIQLLEQQHAFNQIPSVGFFSVETSLYDIISYYPDKNLDIWLLQQAPKKDIPADQQHNLRGKAFPNPIKYYIAIDKQDIHYQAYFFGSAHTTDDQNSTKFMFADTPMNNCFSCHISGVRKLRPGHENNIDELTKEDWNLLKTFNKRILGYGAVVTDWPLEQKMPDSHQLEALADKKCQPCHDMNSIQAPILRLHQMPMARLFEAHQNANGYFTRPPELKGQRSAMPPVLPSTQAVKDAVQNWIDAN
jgi:mono/diheme cytochrome c family protein